MHPLLSLRVLSLAVVMRWVLCGVLEWSVVVVWSVSAACHFSSARRTNNARLYSAHREGRGDIAIADTAEDIWETAIHNRHTLDILSLTLL